MAIGVIDYVSSCFKCKTSALMRNKPMHKSLKRLKLELEANTISIETDLGGDNDSYLGLALADAEHAVIPNTQPFVGSNYLLPLVMLAIVT